MVYDGCREKRRKDQKEKKVDKSETSNDERKEKENGLLNEERTKCRGIREIGKIERRK